MLEEKEVSLEEAIEKTFSFFLGMFERIALKKEEEEEKRRAVQPKTEKVRFAELAPEKEPTPEELEKERQERTEAEKAHFIIQKTAEFCHNNEPKEAYAKAIALYEVLQSEIQITSKQHGFRRYL